MDFSWQGGLVATWSSPSSALLQLEIIQYNQFLLFIEKLPNEVLLAVILDPRYKHMRFFSVEEQETSNELLKTMYKSVSPSVTIVADDPPELEQVDYRPYKRVKFDYGEVAVPLTEIQRYLYNTATLHRTESPLLWWKEHAQTFPVLARLARIYLSICATSVPSERLFSDAGNVINKKRSTLKPSMVETLVYLYSNQNYW